MEATRSDPIGAAIVCLQRLTEIFQIRRRQLAQSVGLTEQQWAVLEQITNVHFMPSMFARSRDSSAAAVSKILRQLTDKRLIIARVGAGDARQRRYELTPQGKKTMAMIRRGRENAIELIWKPLPVRELEAFTQFGSRLTEQLENYAHGSTERPRMTTSRVNGTIPKRIRPNLGGFSHGKDTIRKSL
jgi:DNA-binding MarR family transcriptional regulator